MLRHHAKKVGEAYGLDDLAATYDIRGKNTITVDPTVIIEGKEGVMFNDTSNIQ